MTGETISRRVPPAALAAPALVVTLACFPLPLLAAAAAGLTSADGSDITLAHVRRLAGDPAYLAALARSLQDTAVVTAIALLLAFPLARILAECLPRRLQPLALLLVVLPALASAAARAYAWRLTLAPDGPVATGLVDAGLLGGAPQLLGSRAATIIALTHVATALMTLAIFIALRRLDTDARRAAADLGAGPVRRFLHLVLPLARPGIIVGIFLTFALALGDPVTPRLLGPAQEPWPAQLVVAGIGSGDLPTAAALAAAMAALTALVWLACAAWLAAARR